MQRLENDALNPKLAADVVGPEPEAMFESAPADLRGWNNVAEAAAGAGAGNDLMDAGEFGGGGGGEPSLEYEFTRRRIQTNIAEIWNFFSSELGKVRKAVSGGHANTADLEESINQVLLQGAEHKRSLLSDMERMRQSDGYEAWRHKEARDLSDLVQRRLHHLQNPSDCQNARKLVCKLNKVGTA